MLQAPPSEAVYAPAVGSTTGVLFRVQTFGESHGPELGAVIDGCPPGLPLDEATIQQDLDRRRPGQSRIVTQRKEADRVRIVSGVFEGRTTGTPIALVIANDDQRSGDYEEMRTKYRPSHADYTYEAKYGLRDHRGGGRASARETAARVAAGAVARVMLERHGIEALAWVSQVGELDHAADPAAVTREAIEATPVRCPDADTAWRMIQAIEAARKDGDSLGGVVTAVARGVPPGLGEPVFDKLDADLAKAMLSLPAAKGFEIGSGFAGTRLRGSEHNDLFYRDGERVRTRTNRSGGVQGGISNGEDVIVRVAFKPTATVLKPQPTVDQDGSETVLEPRGRHDPCVLPRAAPIVEAALLLVLADHWLRQRAIR